ncbi:MAG TPA: hypothetical protein PK876_06980 [Elusimicrobiota bacterium]|nr:hypothetical protein [Elusimicrobiota bacterium]
MSSRFFHWAPRILSLLFVAFLSLFAFDTVGEHAGGSALLMHLLIPLSLLVIVLLVWKWDWAGALVFFFVALSYVGMVGLNRPWSWYLTISGPAVLISALFLTNHYTKRR